MKFNEKKLIEKLEALRRDTLDGYNDHKPLVAEYLGEKIDESGESLDIDTLTRMYEAVQSSNCSEYEDIWYLTGWVCAIEFIINQIKKGGK